jgi:hypothetical protein
MVRDLAELHPALDSVGGHAAVDIRDVTGISRAVIACVRCIEPCGEVRTPEMIEARHPDSSR